MEYLIYCDYEQLTQPPRSLGGDPLFNKAGTTAMGVLQVISWDNRADFGISENAEVVGQMSFMDRGAQGDLSWGSLGFFRQMMHEDFRIPDELLQKHIESFIPAIADLCYGIEHGYRPQSPREYEEAQHLARQVDFVDAYLTAQQLQEITRELLSCDYGVRLARIRKVITLSSQDAPDVSAGDYCVVTADRRDVPQDDVMVKQISARDMCIVDAIGFLGDRVYPAKTPQEAVARFLEHSPEIAAHEAARQHQDRRVPVNALTR